MNYLSTRRQIEGALPTAAELVQLKSEVHALRILTLADIELVETGYDNWNGGTELWTAYLRVPVSEFVAVEQQSEHIAQIISANIDAVLGKDVGFWVRVETRPQTTLPTGSTTGKVLQMSIHGDAAAEPWRRRGVFGWGHASRNVLSSETRRSSINRSRSEKARKPKRA